ncbi:MAG TPA: type II toxin-antitoxin system RelE/ParE family toxin [Candidatus Nanoarchaeia archaeon]|nr:type II toxin-antitoxin system RelE/ParE family toxin [Candidatus Nanoarchaeia archaeon]
MFEVMLDKQAEKFLKKCENSLFVRINSKLKELKLVAVPHDAKRVHGYSVLTFRIRIGDYRALYRVNYSDSRIVVVKIDKRGAVY